MIGFFLARALILVFGYAYPAYDCYKTVELNKPEIAKLRFWCQYWILVALLTVLERFTDPLISWLPFYGEAKLCFVIYLWYPKTKGTAYIYETFFKPFISKHEREIDRNLVEVRTRASDMAILHGQKVLVYVQNLIFEGLRYISSHPIIPKNQKQSEPEPTRESTNDQTDAPTLNPKTLNPKLIKTTTITKEKKQATAPPSPLPKKPVPIPSSPVVKKPALVPSSPVEPIPESELEASSSDETEEKEMEKEETEESVLEETIRVTRAKLRKRMGNIGTGTVGKPDPKA